MRHNPMMAPRQEAADMEPMTPRDTFAAPVRSSGRMNHMALAFELGALAMRCRISHPVLSQALESMNRIAIGHQRADDHQLSLLRGGPVGTDAPLDTEDTVPLPFDADLDAPDRWREAQGEDAAEIGDDPLVQLVVGHGERDALAEAQQRAWVESEAKRIEAILDAHRPRPGFVERVMARVRGRAA